jgi:hypothetical protein
MIIMRQQFPLAEIVGHESLIDNLTNHPKERHVLAAAIVADAPTIVTRNLRDFPVRARRPFRIEAQSPDDFLLDLSQRAHERVVRFVHKQAQALRRPPVSVEELLYGLALHAPNFVAELQQRMGL